MIKTFFGIFLRTTRYSLLDVIAAALILVVVALALLVGDDPIADNMLGLYAIAAAIVLRLQSRVVFALAFICLLSIPFLQLTGHGYTVERMALFAFFAFVAGFAAALLEHQPTGRTTAEPNKTQFSKRQVRQPAPVPSSSPSPQPQPPKPAANAAPTRAMPPRRNPAPKPAFDIVIPGTAYRAARGSVPTPEQASKLRHDHKQPKRKRHIDI